MKQLKEFINEKLHISNYKKQEYNYHPETKYRLKELIKQLIKERGNEADLNDIDTSKIDDMWCLFRDSEFNGDISKWDVSNVTNMYSMFESSKFNGDISNWDVSNVKEIQCIFKDSKFNQDISKWNINIKDSFKMYQAFKNCLLEKNPPKWYKE